MLFLGHPAISQSSISKDVIEIVIMEDFGRTLTRERVWNRQTLVDFRKTKEFLRVEPREQKAVARDRKILMDFLAIDGVTEISFQSSIITIRISDDKLWGQVLPEIEKIMTEHLIIPKN